MAPRWGSHDPPLCSVSGTEAGPPAGRLTTRLLLDNDDGDDVEEVDAATGRPTTSLPSDNNEGDEEDEEDEEDPALFTTK